MKMKEFGPGVRIHGAPLGLYVECSKECHTPASVKISQKDTRQKRTRVDFLVNFCTDWLKIEAKRYDKHW